MKVLIAEGSNAMRGIIREMMMRLGYDDIVEGLEDPGGAANEAAGLEDPGPGRGDQRGLRHADGGDQDGGGGSSVAVGEYRWADRAVGGALRAVLIAQKNGPRKSAHFFYIGF